MWFWQFSETSLNQIKPSSQRAEASGDLETLEEEENERSEFGAVIRQMGPWVSSFVFHLGLVILALFLVWMVWEPEPDEDMPIIPLAKLSPTAGGMTKSEDTELKSEQRIKEVEATDKAKDESLEELVNTTQSQLLTIGIAGGGGGGALAPFGTAVGPGTGVSTGFFGPPGGNAKKIIYVIDASGSLVDTMPFVIKELNHSISNLSSEQEFTVIFFQNGTPVEVPLPTRGWKMATPNNKAAAQDWIETKLGNISPTGRTDPRRAIQLAMNYEPELVFLLSDNITGSGRFEINRDELIGFFKSIKHKVAINTIQFLNEDPLGTLREISAMKGGIYKYVSEKDLGKRRG